MLKLEFELSTDQQQARYVKVTKERLLSTASSGFVAQISQPQALSE
jgi:hypothetical protein